MISENDAASREGTEQRNLKPFTIGGKCLAFHGPLLYEAKILRIWDPVSHKLIDEGLSHNNKSNNLAEDENEIYPPEKVRNKQNYFIHYQGWKSTWDEWIGIDRIREYNNDNIALKKSLAQEARNNKKLKQQDSRKRKSGTSLISPVPITDSNKRRNTQSPDVVNKNGVSSKPSVYYQSGIRNDKGLNDELMKKNIQNNTISVSGDNGMNIFDSTNSKFVLHIPVKLKAKLVDDWELVTKDKRICTLPSKVTVNQLLVTYKKQTTKHMSLSEQFQLNEFVSGLVEYFEDALSKLLLYRLERLQYEVLLKQYKDNGKKLVKCDIYGALHLLRLISILPEMISGSTMDIQSSQLIIKQCERLLVWMTINIDVVFPTLNPREDVDVLVNNAKGYENTSSQYEGVALGL